MPEPKLSIIATVLLLGGALLCMGSSVPFELKMFSVLPLSLGVAMSLLLRIGWDLGAGGVRVFLAMSFSLAGFLLSVMGLVLRAAGAFIWEFPGWQDLLLGGVFLVCLVSMPVILLGRRRQAGRG